MRVVSLLPSATEILHFIGAGELLVGRSHECDWPPQVAEVPCVSRERTARPTGADASVRIDQAVRDALSGGNSLYSIDEQLLAQLRPDLILTQDLCTVCSIDLASVERIARSLPTPPRILSLNPRNFWDVLDDLLRVGDAVGRPLDAQRAMVALRERWWSVVDQVNPFLDGPEVLFLEWMDPPFVAGHWTPQLIETAGGRHSLNKTGANSRVAMPEEIVECAPQRIVVAPCGYSLAQVRAELDHLRGQRWWGVLPATIAGSGRVALVDGNQAFNRPGPRLVDSLEWLAGWLNDRPELIPAGFPAELV